MTSKMYFISLLWPEEEGDGAGREGKVSVMKDNSSASVFVLFLER